MAAAPPPANTATDAGKPLLVALCGNPNTGKSTLFNQLTGANAHVGNYPGITVERKTGSHAGPRGIWHIDDLPGCYSLVAHSPEEEIAHMALCGAYGPRPDVVVVVVDGSNLARNLLLVLQVGELGLPVVVACNLMDAARLAGWRLDLATLQTALHCPVVALVARTGEGLPALRHAVQAVADEPQLGQVTPTAWSVEVQTAMAAARKIDDRLALASPGELAWWLAADVTVADKLAPGLGSRLHTEIPRDPAPDRDIRRRLVNERFARIDRITQQSAARDLPAVASKSDRADAILLHPVYGTLLFLLAMGLLFQAVFAWATPMADAVNTMMRALARVVAGQLPPGLGREVVVDGLLAGVAGALVFLPQILVLFFGIAVLEDTGYLARAAFLVDRVMAKAGLPGKAFVPLLSSYACAVPGIMATRTMSDPRDRLLTILIAPLMSCSARLPVYTLVTAAVFADIPKLGGVVAVGGLVVAAMYALGFVLALLVAMVLRRSLVPGVGAPLLLEMPPYRLPRPGNLGRVLWQRATLFLRDTGTTIVALSVVLWALMSFPRTELEPAARQAIVAQLPAADHAVALTAAQSQLRLQHSIAGRIGHALEPAIAPLGFDWRIGIGLVGSLAAREVLVPVMAQVYGKGSRDDVDDAFAADVGQAMAKSGGLTPLKGVSLMVFFAIAMQCLNTLATMRKETGGWRWPLFAFAYLNGLAWLASLTVYQVGQLLGYR